MTKYLIEIEADGEVDMNRYCQATNSQTHSFNGVNLKLKNVTKSQEPTNDIDALTQYIFENEIDDFIFDIQNSEEYIEENILFQEDINLLCSVDINDEDGFGEADPIIQKACENTKCMHPYALAWRIYKNL